MKGEEVIRPADAGRGGQAIAGSRRHAFEGLAARGLLTREELDGILGEAAAAGLFPETPLLRRGIPKHELLRCLAEWSGLPFVEFHEGLSIPAEAAGRVDLEELKRELWVPVSLAGKTAGVVVREVEDPRLDERIKARLGVEGLEKSVALATDIVRIIEHNQDVNPGFPPSAHRTLQARLRNHLADLRTLMAGHRTAMAKGRTGLAMMRTGLAFKAVVLTMIKIFGPTVFLLPALVGVPVGLVLFIQGLVWYVPVRRLAKGRPSFAGSDSTFGSSVLEMVEEGGRPSVRRGKTVEGAEALRMDWSRLSPVMRRRFLAVDRTDMAEERTVLASYRTAMAVGRTGLGFTRTGIAFIGLGIALWRQFPASAPGWIAFYASMTLVGLLMTLEGFYWYLPGRRAAEKGLEVIKKGEGKISIWDFMYNLFRRRLTAGELPAPLCLKETYEPGIWGTTGLALERTLIAERRNVMARLRTIMARSRTGMAIIRTGAKVFVVGFVLLAYFGTGEAAWTVCESLLMLVGLVLVVDGFYWHLPAERARNELPHCVWDLEIVLPDYARPNQAWSRIVFSHDER